MGSCFSASYNDSSVSLSTAKVISLHGNLREYSVPVTVSQVLEKDASTCFLCSSDCLFYDAFIPPLHTQQQLQGAQIYFILPNTRLQHRLMASDMAALAIKASSALGQSSKKGRRGRSKKMQISPVLDVNQSFDDSKVEGLKKFDSPSLGISRYGSIRKQQRNASRRAKLAIRSFRMRLTTIYEVPIAE